MSQIEASMSGAMEQVTVFITTYGLSVVGGIVLLIVGWTLAGWASGGVDLTLARIKTVDLTLRRFVASVVRYLILTFTMLAVLSQFGVQTASLIAVFGAAGLAIGLALQGTLAHLASGVMILIFRPFKIGERVDAGGHVGVVESIDLFTTELRTPDNVQLLVPNGKIWGTSIINYSIHKTRRLDLKLVIDDTVDLDQAITTVQSTLGKDPRALTTPPPSVTMSELNEKSVTLAAQVWCTADDYGELKVVLMKRLREGLKSALKTVSG